MKQAETTVRHQEALNAAITDRLARRQADHYLDMQYLIQFGVKASEREAFREILQAVSQHGGLSLREAAEMAHTTAPAARSTETQRNGDSSSESPTV